MRLSLLALIVPLTTLACDGGRVEGEETPSSPLAGADGHPAAAADPPAETEPETRVSPDGLEIQLLEKGAGSRARLGDRVLLHYRGRIAANDEIFRSTWLKGIPEELTLGRREVIPGLERALLGLRPGTRAQVRVPAALAYGETGLGKIPPNSDLHFEIHLVAIRNSQR